MEILGGARCSCCGCDELDYLEFNHIDGGGCRESRESTMKRGYCSGVVDRLLSGERSPEGLNVLCRLCNALDYLARKNPTKIGCFIVRWENLTGEKAHLQKS